MGRYFSRQVLLNLLPDWVIFVGKALFHSLKESGFQKKVIIGRAENKIQRFLVRKTSECLQYLFENIINVIKYDILIYGF